MSDSYDNPTVTYGGPTANPFGILTRGDCLGRYVVLEEIGAGGMGVVYAAYDPELDRQVALKVLPAATQKGDEARLRLLREARALAKVVHPNVVAVHDVGTVGEQIFLAMELVKGEDLAAWLIREDREWRGLVEVFVEAGRGLAAVHHAGLAHRDFKPANVRLGDDGRVRVLDFGLAQGAPLDEDTPLPQSDDPSDASPHLLNRAITQEGRVFGTPRYMAPEQLQGRRADARSDQFAFCVALWEALFRCHPFADQDEDPLAAMEKGIVDPSTESKVPAESKVSVEGKVPAALHQALRRGLSFSPEDRYPSLEELLDALGQIAGKAPRRRLVLVAALLALATVAALWNREDPPCSNATERMAGIWDESRRARIEEAFQRATIPEAAADTWSVTRPLLDRYADDWQDLHQEVCEATHVRQEQSAGLFDLRMACLEERRQELRTLLDLFVEADAELVNLADDAVSQLSSLRSCSDLRRLTLPVPIEDPLVESQVGEIRGRLASVRALRAAGHFDDGLNSAETGSEAAHALGYEPLVAETHLELGAMYYRSSQPKKALKAYGEARRAADAGRHDVVRAEALHGLMWLAGDGHASTDDSLRWRREARAVVQRLDDDPELLMRWQQAVARLLRRERRLEEAADATSSAVALSETLYGPDHPTTASIVATLGTIDAERGRFQDAIERFERALQARVSSLGERHPDVGSVQQQLANIFIQLGRYEEAVSYLESSLTIAQHQKTDHKARVLADLGYSEIRLGRDQSGIAHIQESLSLWRSLRGDRSLKVAETLNYLGDSYLEIGDFASAEERLSEAMTLYRNVGHDAFPVALNLQRALIGLGRLKEARALLDATRSTLSPNHYLTIWLELVDAEWLFAAGRITDAVARFEHVVSQWQGSQEASPLDLAMVRLKLAETLRRAGREIPARNQALLARDTYRGQGAAGLRGLGAAEQWLAIHGSPS